MRVLVTGAGGFIGQVLIDRLLSKGLHGKAVSSINAIDLVFVRPFDDERVTHVTGNIASREFCEQMLAQPFDVVFHLASVPGGAAEKDYGLGRGVNLDATLYLLEGLSRQHNPAHFVYASSVAVYGDPLPSVVTDNTLALPVLTYGTHKLACEYFIADANRKGWVKGCSLRLPGVVARPGDGAGFLSAFMSQIFWRLQACEAVTVPVRRNGTAWWISAVQCAENLMHAAVMTPQALSNRSAYQMPAIWASVGDVVSAICTHVGVSEKHLVCYEPEEHIQRLFASYPPLSTPVALKAGFMNDGSLDMLVLRCLEQA